MDELDNHRAVSSYDLQLNSSSEKILMTFCCLLAPRLESKVKIFIVRYHRNTISHKTCHKILFQHLAWHSQLIPILKYLVVGVASVT